MDIDWATLKAEATKAMKKAYAPYSNFPVGAAALTDKGEIISGSHTGAIRTWDLGANKCAHELMPEGDTPIASVAIAADASLVAAANFNGSCFFWAPGDEE